MYTVSVVSRRVCGFTSCFCPHHSADERFDATFHTNVLVNSSGACQYIPPGEWRALLYIYIYIYIYTGNGLNLTNRMNILTVTTEIYCFFLLTNVLIGKSLWIKASAKCPQCKCKKNLKIHAFCITLSTLSSLQIALDQ